MAWGDTTVKLAAEAFSGTYDAPLRWQQEPLSAGTHTPIDVQDNLRLTIAYEGVSVLRDCQDRLHVPVIVTLSTDSGIAESGGAVLEISRSAEGDAAHLTYDGERVALDAMLTDVAGGITLTGALESLDDELPGASASFTVEP